MKFFVNEKEFDVVLDLSDSINIKSAHKDYKVIYNSKNLDTLITEIYKNGDFIFIDRNVYNLIY